MEKSTTLTPSMERMFSSRPQAATEDRGGAPSSSSSSSSSQRGGKRGSASDLRHMVESCLADGISSTACLLADRLLRLPDSTPQDIVLFARCFQAKGEPRRCLATLEHKGLLAAQAMTSLSSALSPRVIQRVATVPTTLYCHLDAVHLAAQCLLSLEQYDDCVHLLDPLLLAVEAGLDAATIDLAVTKARLLSRSLGSVGTAYSSAGVGGASSGGVSVMASVYSLAGRCHDMLENKPRAALCLSMALRVDPACAEAAEYLVDHGLVSRPEKRRIFSAMDLSSSGREWLELYYRFLLLDEVSAATERDLLGGVGCREERDIEEGGEEGESGEHESREHDDSLAGLDETASQWAGQQQKEQQQPPNNGIDVRLSSMILVKRAERLYDNQYPAEAYRLARQAYVLDPFDSKGLLVYVAAMVQLQLTTELFYLGHELSKTYPKVATSW